MTLDYFYGQTGELFSFYRIPKALFQEQRFQSLSTDAKTLYGILLDRMSLSVKNGWLDKQNRVLSDKLFEHCAEIEEAARKRMELIVPKLAKQYGVTEQLKADNQMEWVRQMNACKAQAEEIVKAELIYD